MDTMFQRLRPWLNEITASIRKDIKTDFLPGSHAFYRTYFGNRPQSRVSFEEIQEAFAKELLAGNEEMAEWVVNRWVFKHGDLYTHFAERMMGINPQFDEIVEFTLSQSEEILKGAIEAFGAKAVYLFSVLNKVVFPASILDRLEAAAEKEVSTQKTEQAASAQAQDLSKLIETHQREMSRLNEKFEQKIAGVLKKYTLDVEALKKQVRALQKQLAAKS
ncbi:MAG TPA: hypothetical protein VGM34_01510 [Chlamydiales bacterium]|jgi:hypothetical protein